MAALDDFTSVRCLGRRPPWRAASHRILAAAATLIAILRSRDGYGAAHSTRSGFAVSVVIFVGRRYTSPVLVAKYSDDGVGSIAEPSAQNA